MGMWTARAAVLRRTNAPMTIETLDVGPLASGDVLVRFGNKPIMNLYDFTDALRQSKVGDVVEVTVQRDDKPLKVSVTLEVRR